MNEQKKERKRKLKAKTTQLILSVKVSISTHVMTPARTTRDKDLWKVG
jgi:hypothetical protein